MKNTLKKVTHISYELFIQSKVKVRYQKFRTIFMVFIVMSILFSIFSSEQNTSSVWSKFITWTYFCFGLIFLVELILSIISLYFYQKSSYKKSLFKTLLNFDIILKFIGTISFLLPVVLNEEHMTVLYILRMLRLLTIVNMLGHQSIEKAWKVLFQAFYSKRNELFILFITSLFLLIFAATGIYVFEHTSQPKVFSSIPESLWWAIVTLTTVGYGDVVPITMGGRIFAGIVAIFGVLIVTIPGSIITIGLLDTVNKTKKQIENNEMRTLLKKTGQCPHCHKSFLLKESLSDLEKLNKKKIK